MTPCYGGRGGKSVCVVMGMGPRRSVCLGKTSSGISEVVDGHFEVVRTLMVILGLD